MLEADASRVRPTILVVDDEVIIRITVASYLRDLGYRTLEAGTAEEAQAILRAGEAVDVVFSDVRLGPGIGGFELAGWVRRHRPGVRVLLTSGILGLSEAAAPLSDLPLLAKPYLYGELAKAIERLARGHRRLERDPA